MQRMAHRAWDASHSALFLPRVKLIFTIHPFYKAAYLQARNKSPDLLIYFKRLKILSRGIHLQKNLFMALNDHNFILKSAKLLLDLLKFR
jgi:hypothetical protein